MELMQTAPAGFPPTVRSVVQAAGAADAGRGVAAPGAVSAGDVAVGRRDLRAALLLGLVCLLVYNANFRLISASDCRPARYLPFAIVRHGTLTFDPILDAASEGRLVPSWLATNAAGHWLSVYPVVLPLVASPLYVPAVAYLEWKGWETSRVQRVARIMEKATASVLAAVAVALMYVLLRRRAGRRAALLLAAVFAFGTTTWMISSQAMWQHGVGEILMIAALLVLTAPCTPARALAAGALCALMVANRPPDVILAAGFAVFAFFWAGWRRALLVLAGGALPLALLLVYNLGMIGSLAGGYLRQGSQLSGGAHAPAGAAAQIAAALSAITGNRMASGLAGILFSPARGLLVFSPFLLFVPLGFRRTLVPARRDRELTLCLAVAAAVQVALYSKGDWRAGYSWGPRWLTDLVPLLVWMLPPALAGLRRAGRATFAVLAAAAIVIEVVGAFWYTGASEAAIYAPPPKGADVMSGTWPLANAPFVAELRHPHAPADLTLTIRGAIDLPSAGRPAGTARAGGQSPATALPGGRSPADMLQRGRPPAHVPAGEPLHVMGWALAGSTAPAEVVVGLDDGVVALTSEFIERPDVRATFHQSGPAGWTAVLPAAKMLPGKHLLQAWVRARAGSQLVPLVQVPLVAGPAAAAPAVAAPETAATSVATPAVATSIPAAAAPPMMVLPAATPTLVSATVAPRLMAATVMSVAAQMVMAAVAPAATAPAAALAPAAPAAERQAPAASAGQAGAGLSGIDLDAAALEVAAALRAHQQEGGYWLTSFTSRPIFQAPRQEMNTFLTAMMVDLLAPVAERAGLEESVQRAQRHLAAQIEANGLVRYHGLPDSPEIRRGLGCAAMTPDADDTALAWRLAGPVEGAEARLSQALAVLRDYRTPEGLYRTWLAPREEYRCIDPGSQPDPADVGIQMHVYLLLAGVDPRAARELCGALQRGAADDGVWFYYTMAPLVPTLRLADLRQAGCPLDLPPARLASAVPGQASWLAAARLLARLPDYAAGPPTAAAEAEARALLASLAPAAAPDPPLLYHNDLTASTPRFYWSEDFGHALWLRIYFQIAAR